MFTDASESHFNAKTLIEQFCAVIVDGLRDQIRWLDDYAVCSAAMDVLVNLSRLFDSEGTV